MKKVLRVSQEFKQPVTSLLGHSIPAALAAAVFLPGFLMAGGSSKALPAKFHVPAAGPLAPADVSVPRSGGSMELPEYKENVQSLSASSLMGSQLFFLEPKNGLISDPEWPSAIGATPRLSGIASKNPPASIRGLRGFPSQSREVVPPVSRFPSAIMLMNEQPGAGDSVGVGHVILDFDGKKGGGSAPIRLEIPEDSARQDGFNGALMDRRIKQLWAEYESAVDERRESLREKIDGLKKGPFGAVLSEWRVPGVPTVLPTLNGERATAPFIRAKLKKEEIPGEEDALRESWRATQERIRAFQRELEADQDLDRADLDRTQYQIERVRAAVIKKQRESILKSGLALQAWGVPSRVSVNQNQVGELRFSSLYNVGGAASRVGHAFYQLLSPIMSSYPDLLGRLTGEQFHKVVEIIYSNVDYLFEINLEGRLVEGYFYPEYKEALRRTILRLLIENPSDGETPYGISPKTPDFQPTPVLGKLLEDSKQRLEAGEKEGRSPSELDPLRQLVLALHAVMGKPFSLSSNPPPLLSRYLEPILAALWARGADEATVMRAIIRQFPFGENIWRLKIHRLWKNGIRGDGVKLGLIDEGVDPDFPDLKEAKIVANTDYVNNFTMDRGWHNKGEHGTGMAAIIHSLAPGAEIHSYKVVSNPRSPAGMSLGWESQGQAVLDALDRSIADGMDVVLLPFGRTGGEWGDTWSRKIAELAARGIIVVASAGHEGENLPTGFQVTSPGSAPDAITVGMVDFHWQKPLRSSSGMVRAGGVHVNKPEIHIFGVNLPAAMVSPGGYQAGAGLYQMKSGTSGAAAQGAVASILMVDAARQAGLSLPNSLAIQAAKRALLFPGACVNERNVAVLRDMQAAVESFVRLLWEAMGL